MEIKALGDWLLRAAVEEKERTWVPPLQMILVVMRVMWPHICRVLGSI